MTGIAIAIGCLLLALFFYWQNNGLVISSVIYQHPQLPPDFDGWRILHISDLHNKSFGKAQRRLLTHASRVEPNAIVITGDLINKRRMGMAAALAFAKQAVKIAPVYFVPGNHECESGTYKQLRSRLLACGAVVLDNTCAHVTKNGQSICILGLSDEKFFQDEQVYKHTLADLAEGQGFKLLLTHRPEKFELYRQEGVSLALAGHAHGGQWRLPFVGGLYAPHQGVFPKYTSGLYQSGTTGMVVSRGLGNSLFPLRLFNRPELVVVTLKRGQALSDR